MDDFQSKLSSILENPAMMEQIMAMANNLNQSPAPAAEPAAASSDAADFPQLDLSMIQKLSGLVSSTGVDQNQKFLLKALSPYLPSQRIEKLEKAMRAVKLARFASHSLGQLKFPPSSGR